MDQSIKRETCSPKHGTIRNNGTCDWTTGYRFVFIEGDAMDGPASMTLDHTVHPGETYTFEVDRKAPSTNGEYTGVWRIKSDDGKSLENTGSRSG